MQIRNVTLLKILVCVFELFPVSPRMVIFLRQVNPSQLSVSVQVRSTDPRTFPIGDFAVSKRQSTVVTRILLYASIEVFTDAQS